MPKVHFENVDPAGDFKPVPNGEYEVEVIEARTATSKNGDDYIQMDLQIIGADDEEFVGRKIMFVNMSFVEKALPFAMRTLLALGWTKTQLRETEEIFPDDLLGATAFVRVGQKTYEGNTNNVVKTWIIAEEE
jgi:hypothetical protein